MAVGLQVWNSSGTLILDVSDRIGRLHQIVSFSISNNETITYSIPGHDPNDSSWFLWTPQVLWVNFTPVLNGVTLKHLLGTNSANTTVTGQIRVLRS